MGKLNELIYDENQEALEQLWQEFETLIPDNSAGLDFVLNKLFEYKLIRCNCGNNLQEQFKRIEDRILKCSGCARKIRFMAATCFRYVKHLKAWLGAIYLKERRVIITSYRLTRLCNIAPATAHNIVTTLGFQMYQELEKKHGDNVLTVSLNAFLEVLFKRSLISVSYKHPSIPPEERNEADSTASRKTTKEGKEEPQDHNADEPESSNETVQECGDDELSGENKLVFELIRQIPISPDEICKLTGLSAAQIASAVVMLELIGLIEPHPGNRFTRITKKNTRDFATKLDETVMEIAGRAFYTIEAIYGGVSRKYLQLYLAIVWCRYDSKRWCEDSLLKILLRGEPVKLAEILKYVSPPIVALSPAS